MITSLKISKTEEIALLHNVAIAITKKLKKSISFNYQEKQKVDFYINLENELKVNIKNLLPEKIYNAILLSATLDNDQFCVAIIGSTGYELCEKLAHSLFYLQKGIIKNQISKNIQHEDASYDYNQKIEHYLGLEADQRKLVKNFLIQNKIMASSETLK